MYTLRTRFAKDIVTEFLPPTRPTKTNRVAIICGGMPGFPGKKDILEFFSKKGFWAFNPRYRGSWESDGLFLNKSPHQDVLDVISQLPNGFTDIWNNKKYKINPDKLYVIGTSFGGPAAILSSIDQRVTKAVCIAPVVDWRHKNLNDSIKTHKKFTQAAFGKAYRISRHGWKKLASGKFYNPANHIRKIDGSKLLMFHAEDDETAPYLATKRFCQKTGARLVGFKTGGHLSSSITITPRFHKIFKEFIKK